MVSLAPPARVRVWSASLGGLGGRGGRDQQGRRGG